MHYNLYKIVSLVPNQVNFTMKKQITTILTILFFGSIQAQQVIVSEPITVEIGNLYKIKSSILKEDRNVLIHLPEEYQKSKTKYPVIYVLDGDNHFQHASNAASILQENERMPQSIIVAIPNNPGTRSRDLARGRDKFKQFIKDEVIPFVEKNYRTTNHKTIFGHSMAGAFILNYLATEPSLFDNYIAASPMIQIFNSELLVKFHELFKKQKTLQKNLYFTLTSIEEEGNRATEALTKFVDLLKNEAPKTLSWKYDYIENQVHMTTPYLTMYQGFSTVFKDFQSPVFADYEAYKNRGGMHYLKAYYLNRANKYQTSVQIPENTLRRLAFVLLNDNQSKIAIDLLKENIKNYPQSAGAYNSLASAYETINDDSNALKTYQMAVKLAAKQSSPNTSYYTRQLKRVEKKLKG